MTEVKELVEEAGEVGQGGPGVHVQLQKRAGVCSSLAAAPWHQGWPSNSSSPSCGALQQEYRGHPLARLGWLLQHEPMFTATSTKQHWCMEEFKSCTGERPEETLAGVSHLQWPPHCFLAFLSLMVEEGGHNLQLVQPSPGAAGHVLVCLPFASRTSLVCSPRAVSVSSRAEGSAACVGLCLRSLREDKEGHFVEGREEERGKKSDATWVCHIPLRKVEHLCDDGRAAGK